jgi:putative ABC transport system substrate-binding protein
MQRRRLIGAVGLWAAAHKGVAQPVRKVYRIGVVIAGLTAAEIAGPQTLSPSVNALLRGLRDLGYVYGEHFVIEPRSSEGKPERFPSLAGELVASPVDVIVALGPALPALKQATSTIPIVMTGSADPVGQGFVQSLARPGGNITGLSLQSVDTVGKRLELLADLVRPAGPIAVLWDRYSLLHWQAAQAAARAKGWKLLSLEIRDTGEIEGAFAAARHARASALLVFNSALLDPQAGRITMLAARSRLPAMYGFRPYVEAGGLMSYGPDLVDNWRRAAVFVDKILKGAKPADLPVEQPIKFELVINLKAAKALGLTIPQSLLLRADEVIE